jgi:hypothetical protein
MIRRFLGRFFALSILLLLAAAPLSALPNSARAESVDAVQTTLYFGLRTGDGFDVTPLDWRAFLVETVTPRFPNGLTVLEAYGQSSRQVDGVPVGAQLTRVLIVVHPASAEATAAVAEIKAAWRARFPGAGLFHTESDVRIVED